MKVIKSVASFLLLTFMSFSCFAMDAGDGEKLPRKTPELSKWLEHSANNYFAHAIQPSCLRSVLEDKRLAPAELILREKYAVNFESEGMGQSRTRVTVNKEEIDALQEEYQKLPQICRGVAYVHVETVEGKYQLSFFRPNEENAVVYSTENKEDFFSSRKNEFFFSLRDLFSFMTGKSLEDSNLNIAIPILDCGLVEGGLNLRAAEIMKFRRNMFIDEPEYESQIESFRELVAAKSKVPYRFLAHLLDEKNNRSVIKNLLETFKAYSEAIHQFYSTYADSLEISEESVAELIRWKLSYAKTALSIYRSNFFKSEKLVDTICFSLSKIGSDYGTTAILVGNADNKISNGLFEMFNGIEYRTINSIDNGGEYVTINLSDDDVLIVGPKQDLEEYSQKLPELNIVFSEEIPEELKQHFSMGRIF